MGFGPDLINGDRINQAAFLEKLNDLEKNDKDRIFQSYNFDVSDHNSYFDIFTSCIYAGLKYSELKDKTLPFDKDEIGRAIVTGRNAAEDSFKYIGYWKAKMEEKRRNIKSVSKRKEIRLGNLSIIENLLKKSNHQIDREFIIKAMSATDRGERTVKDMIKEVNTIDN
jgi:hypothetical protein